MSAGKRVCYSNGVTDSNGAGPSSAADSDELPVHRPLLDLQETIEQAISTLHMSGLTPAAISAILRECLIDVTGYDMERQQAARAMVPVLTVSPAEVAVKNPGASAGSANLSAQLNRVGKGVDEIASMVNSVTYRVEISRRSPVRARKMLNAKSSGHQGLRGGGS